MNRNSFVAFLEINPVIFCTVAVQLFSLALDHAKPSFVQTVQIRGENLKFCKQLELQPFRQGRHFGGAQLIKNDLKHLDHTYTRATRLPIPVKISHAIVEARSASSLARISAWP